MAEIKKWKKAGTAKKATAGAPKEKVSKKAAAPKTLMGGHKRKLHSTSEIMNSMYGEKNE